jgi:hypothetical protein
MKGIPILSGDTADRFEEIRESNELKKGSIDFSKQIEVQRQIINKSKEQFVFWDEMWNKSKENGR